MKKIAIVGGSGGKWTSETEIKAKRTIRDIFSKYNNECILVSGGCHLGGIDIWAEEIAKELGLKTIIFPAVVHEWSTRGGYRDRNIKIAVEADVVYDIEPQGRRGGGTWTMEYASSIGKEYYHIEI